MEIKRAVKKEEMGGGGGGGGGYGSGGGGGYGGETIATFVWLHIPSADQTLQQFMANLASSHDAVHPLSTTLQQKSTHTTCVDLVLGGLAAVCVLVHESN